MQPVQKTITLSIKKILISIGVIIILFIAYQIFLGNMGRHRYASDISLSLDSEMPAVDFSEDTSNRNASISDTREFMKVSYSGNIKTRDVQDISRDVRGIVRDMNGRIDSENVSEKYGRINFVIPKSNLQDFRDEIESLTHAKLYTENTSSENLLSEKKSLENRSDTATTYLANTQSEKSKLESTYTKEITSLQSQIKTLEKLSQEKISQIGVWSSAQNDIYRDQINQLNQETANIADQISNLRNTITQKNRIYTQERDRLNATITQINSEIDLIKKDDLNFTEKIETVSGSVSIEWVSVWELVKLISPIPPLVITVLLVIIFWYILRKFNKVPIFIVKW